MSTHFFVDETKAKAYVLVAVSCPGSRVDHVRGALRGLVLPGQRSIHMKTESAQRRRLIADAVAGLVEHDVRALIFDAGRGHESETERRGRCLDALAREAAARTPARLVMDLDDTLAAFDRRRIYSAISHRDRGAITYEHARRNEEQLLALPDAIAWCWARAGVWRRRIEPLIAGVRRV